MALTSGEGDPMAQSTVLAEGITFGEGPRWHDGKLWFSDFYDNAVKTCTTDGIVEVAFHTPHQPSGLGWLPDGRMLIVSMQDRTLLRREPDGTLVIHADLNSLATWHANDMVVDAQGRAYVGNFGFDLDTALATRTWEEVAVDHATAILARVDPDGTVHAVAEGLDFPNGAVITPDGRTLIIAESMAARLTAFDIAADGTLSNRRVWAAFDGGRAADGICLDADGQVWVANPSANEAVRVREGGEIAAIIETTQPAVACMLGGPDGRTLFILTSDSFDEATCAASRGGKVEVATVSSPRAGRP